ncbi:DNA-directed RNA polymerase III subunit RPC4 isoform X2 [Frankliniella occidentalis]|uniref:DNA-directed RNA polymerase III subunit RPC4 isoform X2 n=1 Tax=Frankliniella occidentalis TaxID=133901 RepID=A0A9C6UF84_FRAOC|nr:DNA-directed RNA polymerase III subunit RPC4 isoform X2 [Frankliniella occidentalis]
MHLVISVKFPIPIFSCLTDVNILFDGYMSKNLYVSTLVLTMSDEKEQKPAKPTATTIKIEGSSRSSNSIVRLPSFRQPRDLTLGSGSVGRGGALGLGVNKARKNYAPNLNVQRNKSKEEVKVKEEPSKSRGERGRGRGERGKGERGRGRGAANVIQLSSGVFSEGIAAGRRATRGRQEDSNSSYVPKPKLDLKQNYSTDSKEENERLRQLLQDDFVDDPDAVTDGIKPLQLPMIPMKKKGTQKSIKKEPGEEEESDFKPLSEDEGHIVFERRVGDLLGSKKPEYILVQLPDCLPGLRPSVEPDGAKNVNGTSAAGAAVGASQTPQCTLSTIPEGCIGKIQIMRSGRAHLKLGSVSMPITMGTQVGFKQDLISINLDDYEKTGKMINLGQVRARVVVTPDWETLLSKA